jgi:large subunit ribosomal protein L13
MSTFVPSSKDTDRKWFVVDASGKTLGRLASGAARVLSGKNSTQYTPYIDTGDHVIVINAEKIVLTGLKAQQKLYRRYTGFPGGLREEEFTKLLARRSDHRAGHQGHAAEEQDGPPDGDQAQGLQGRQAPA